MGWLANHRTQDDTRAELHELRREAAIEAMQPTEDYDEALHAWDRHDLLDEAIRNETWTDLRVDDEGNW